MVSPLPPFASTQTGVNAALEMFTVKSVFGFGPCVPLTAYRVPLDRKAKHAIAWPSGPRSLATPVTGFTVTSRRLVDELIVVWTTANNTPSLGLATSDSELYTVKFGSVTCTALEVFPVAGSIW